MAIDESARYELFDHFKEILGPKDAGTLMELLPPVGWADVATKHDLGALEKRLVLRLMSAFRGELAIHSQTKVFVLTLIGTLLAYSGGISALVLTR